MIRVHEEEVKTWTTDFSPKSMQLYSEYLQIGQCCKVNANGYHGYEVFEGGDKHCVRLDLGLCTCWAWDLSGIPCPHAIAAMLYKNIDTLTGMHWWFSKEAYLLTYKNKLQPVPGENFWKIEPSQKMEPPDFVMMADRPKVKRDREKNEAIKRQGGWSLSRKGRPSKGKGKAKQPQKKERSLIDEETQEYISLSNPPVS
uniref:SWIM-type domain-containing protein n=3 Tax=Nicotiana TaxID=4085 RepID=A0A1S4AP21_TOBAC|nr:PREDICTED: uncharacterized protein LOC104218175 [Nicotiana sylvestris]XP_016478218.1 PREDICTED: uncharacterized protein LOC107799595 [Nicotiana tabacum]